MDDDDEDDEDEEEEELEMDMEDARLFRQFQTARRLGLLEDDIYGEDDDDDEARAVSHALPPGSPSVWAHGHRACRSSSRFHPACALSCSPRQLSLTACGLRTALVSCTDAREGKCVGRTKAPGRLVCCRLHLSRMQQWLLRMQVLRLCVGAADSKLQHCWGSCPW
jgi:hypothetical protein